jgi:hypothetical protein
VIVGFVGVFAGLFAYPTGSGGMALGIFLGTALAVILIWASAESIAVLTDIEANTRMTAIAMQRSAPQPAADRVEPSLADQAHTPPPGVRNLRNTDKYERFLESVGYTVTWTGDRFVVKLEKDQSVRYAYGHDDMRCLAEAIAAQHGFSVDDLRTG